MSSQNEPYLSKPEKGLSKYFICCKVYEKLPEYWYKVEKMWGAISINFSLDGKLKLAETFVLHSGSKVLCLVVHFQKEFQFLWQTGVVPEKVYASIFSVLEITSLKILLDCTRGTGAVSWSKAAIFREVYRNIEMSLFQWGPWAFMPHTSTFRRGI